MSITPAPPDSRKGSLRERPGTGDGGPGERDQNKKAGADALYCKVGASRPYGYAQGKRAHPYGGKKYMSMFL